MDGAGAQNRLGRENCRIDDVFQVVAHNTRNTNNPQPFDWVVSRPRTVGTSSEDTYTRELEECALQSALSYDVWTEARHSFARVAA